MRKELAKVQKYLSLDAHEYRLWQLINLASGGLLSVRQSFENYVGFQIIEDLVITKIVVFGQVENGLIFLIFLFVIFVVEYLDYALPDEIHLLHGALVADNGLPWG